MTFEISPEICNFNVYTSKEIIVGERAELVVRRAWHRKGENT